MKLQSLYSNKHILSAQKQTLYVLLSLSILQVLWPFLMEFLVPPAYTNAVGIVARCVSDIGSEMRQSNSEEYDINYEEMGMCVCVVWCV